MRLKRIRRKGRFDSYEVREDTPYGYSRLVATLHKAILGGKVCGWNGQIWVGEFDAVTREYWHCSLASALRYYEDKQTDDRIMAKMEAVL